MADNTKKPAYEIAKEDANFKAGYERAMAGKAADSSKNDTGIFIGFGYLGGNTEDQSKAYDAGFEQGVNDRRQQNARKK